MIELGMRRYLISAILWVLLATCVFAQSMGLGLGIAHRPTSAPAYTGPGDVVSGATLFWGLRGYTAAYSTGSNPAAKVCNATTFTTCSTINILSNGKFDTATASGSAACATTCVVSELFDQTGNGNNATCASAAVCPTLTFNCITTLPCMTFAGGQDIAFTGITVSQPYTTTLAFEYTSASTLGVHGVGGINVGIEPQSTQIQYFASSVVTISPTTINTQYALSIVWNNTACASNLNGSSVTGQTCGTGNITAPDDVNLGKDPFHSFTGTAEEFGLWPSPGFSPTQQTNMNTNITGFW